MAQTRAVVRYGLEMRSHFDFSPFKLSAWFPRHMYKGMMQVQAKLHGIDAVIEVHDARIPFCGRNPNLGDIGILRPSILVLNKIDLIEREKTEAIKKKYNDKGIDVVFTHSKRSGDPGVKSIIPKLVNNIESSNRFNRSGGNEINLMVLGIPNVGKSSLLNALRCSFLHRKKAAPVGYTPGVTKSVMERMKVCHNPLMYVRDTPGVLAPRIPSAEGGLKVALAGTIQDHLVGNEVMADFLLFWLNQRGRHEYVQDLELPEATDDIKTVLSFIAVRKKMLHKVQLHDGAHQKKVFPLYSLAAGYFIRRWREGHFGCGLLDIEGGPCSSS